MKFGGDYKVYSKDYGPENACDYIRCYLAIPSFFAGTYTDSWHDENTTIKFDALTRLSLTSSNCHWTFMAYLFGFGICIQRQWDY